MQHDMDYYYGSDLPGNVTRVEADRRLRDCIVSVGDGFVHFLLGWIYFLAVRLFGKQFWGGYAHYGDGYAAARPSIWKLKRVTWFVRVAVPVLAVLFLLIWLWRRHAHGDRNS